MSPRRLSCLVLLPLLFLAAGCVNGVGWLPDSSGFVYTTQRGHLVLYDVAAKTSRVLVEDTKSNTYWPAVSPDGTKIAIARLKCTAERKSQLQVVIYDRQGQVLHESKSIAWGKSAEKPEDMHTTTQLFFDPTGKKLLIYGSVRATNGTTGIYDLDQETATLFERTVPSIYGVTPIRPDGKGFLLAKLSDDGEDLEQLSFVDWQGKQQRLTTKLDLKEDKLRAQIIWPVLRSSAWSGDVAAATTTAGRTRLDTVKKEAVLQPVTPAETSLGNETIWMQATLASGIQVLVLTPKNNEKETYHKFRTITWDPKAKKQIAQIDEGSDRLVGLFSAPDQKHVVFRFWEGDRRGPDADMMYVINAQGQLADTIDVFDRFGRKE